MKNFYKFSKAIDVSRIADELAIKKHLWGLYPHRTDYPGTCHADIEDIWIRYPEIECNTPEGVFNELECVNYQGFFELPSATKAIFKIMSIVRAERLGRCLITKLNSGGKILPHADEGAAADYYTRLHLPIQSNPFSAFVCGEEKAWMKEGELWWFDHKKTHEVINDGPTDRIHLIVDVKISL